MIDGVSVEINQPIVTDETHVENPQTLDLNRGNLRILADLRKKIDGADDERLTREVERYAECLDGRKAFVAAIGSKPVGYVEVKLQENPPDNLEASKAITALAHLSRIGVIPEFRGKGIAVNLMNTAETWVQSQGKTGMWLEYKEANKAAESLYKKCGYQEVGSFMDGHTKRIVVAKRFS